MSGKGTLYDNHSSFLPSSNLTDVTQEVASRGMGLVYEMSPATEKEELVKLLVGTLVEGRK